MKELFKDGIIRDLGAPECDDQIALHAVVGRGIQGNSSKIEISDDESEAVTILTGKNFDAAAQTWTTAWVSENINGGKLTAELIERSGTPKLFQIKFKYIRPGRTEWTMMTPAIPYTGELPEPTEEVVDLIGFATVIGLPKDVIEQIMEGIPNLIESPEFDDIKANTIKQYIDKLVERVMAECTYTGSTYIHITDDNEIELQNLATDEDIESIFD